MFFAIQLKITTINFICILLIILQFINI